MRRVLYSSIPQAAVRRLRPIGVETFPQSGPAISSALSGSRLKTYRNAAIGAPFRAYMTGEARQTASLAGMYKLHAAHARRLR